MYNWIVANKEVLSVIASLGSLVIWLVYAQLLYLGFRRQRRPRLIINRGRNKDIDALCLISNMSAESLFIEYIIAELETSEGTITMDVTDFEQEYEEGDEEQGEGPSPKTTKPSNVSDNTRQGPIKPGDFFHIGTFSELIQRLARDEGIRMRGTVPQGDLEFTRLTLRLIGIYGPEDMPIGAERSFDLKRDNGHYALIPASWNTKRLSSYWHRHKLRKNVEKLNATNFSSASSFRHVNREEDIDNRRAAERASKE
ncbi:hypothetical protein [Marinobacter sp. BGYM27]|uniref:hypothetical protein n=1 Tax=Marinobacter sp. BGYM27 TaxID=2975597 RepID=UPI0021A8D196|nr:hypothetical protein [Marinobacter sp. BGYM27]MDG5500262.1 hypothetical protein [Marinobacter sp. BGYM27]